MAAIYAPMLHNPPVPPSLDALQDDLRNAAEVSSRTRRLLEEGAGQQLDIEAGSQMKEMGLVFIAQSKHMIEINSQNVMVRTTAAVTNELNSDICTMSSLLSQPDCEKEIFEKCVSSVKERLHPDSDFCKKIAKSLCSEENRKVVNGTELLKNVDTDPVGTLKDAKNLVEADQTQQLADWSTFYVTIAFVNLCYTAWTCSSKWTELANMRVDGHSLPDMRAELAAIETSINNTWEHARTVMESYINRDVLPEPLDLQRISQNFHGITNDLDSCRNRLIMMAFKAESQATNSWNSTLSNVFSTALSFAWSGTAARSVGYTSSLAAKAWHWGPGVMYAGAAALHYYTYTEARAKLQEIEVEIQRVRDMQGRLRGIIEQYQNRQNEIRILLGQD